MAEKIRTRNYMYMTMFSHFYMARLRFQHLGLPIFIFLKLSLEISKSCILSSVNIFIHPGSIRQLKANKLSRWRILYLRYISGRKCVTFDRPVGRRKLKDLDKVSDDELTADFLQDSKRFCDHIFQHEAGKGSKAGCTPNGKSRIIFIIINSNNVCNNPSNIPGLFNC